LVLDSASASRAARVKHYEQLVTMENATLDDSSSLSNPFVRRIDEPFEIRIGEDLLRYSNTNTLDNRLRHA
jgi:hypothetical protein